MSDDTPEFVSVDCSECGKPLDIPRPTHTECLDTELPDFEEQELKETVPKEDLRALIEAWRESEEHMASQGVDGWADGIKQCADDLEDLL